MAATLQLQIKAGDPRPIFRQIVDGIGLAIVSGELQAGDQLPSVRALGMQLGINPNTVARAYAELAGKGLVDSRQGLGLFVGQRKQMLNRGERNKRLQGAVQRCVNEVMHLHFSDEEVLKAMEQQLAALHGANNKEAG